MKYGDSESPELHITLLEKIPTAVTVAVLVGIFLALKRYSHSARLQLWMVAWLLIFTHFVAQLLEPAAEAVNPYHYWNTGDEHWNTGMNS